MIEIGDIRTEHGRIGTPFVNTDIWSIDDAFSVRSDVGELNKLNTAVQKSSTNERNKASLRIEEGSLESICPKIIKESNSSKQINLANFLIVQNPKLVHFGHPPMETDNIGHRSNGSVATRVVDQDGIWRPTDRGVRMALTHSYIETISEKLAYHKYIRDSEFETREVFDLETLNQNIENIGTRLDENQMT